VALGEDECGATGLEGVRWRRDQGELELNYCGKDTN